MTKNLKKRTMVALFWSGTAQFGQQAIQFVISIILARLLMPEDFGLIAMVMIIVAVAKSVVNSGFGAALLQKKDATHIDESSIFYFNIVLGVGMAGFFFFAAPWIAAFYEKPVLVSLTRVLSLNLVIGSFGIVQATLLSKEMDFKTQWKIGMIAPVVSGPVGITMAYQGFGVWSLVGQSLSSNLVRTVLLWLFRRWHPAREFSFSSLRIMFGFGSRILLSGLLNTVFKNIYVLVIGKLFSATALGFYSRAKGLQQLPVKNITGAVGRVTFPAFSAVQDDKPRLKRGLRKALTSIAMLNFPMMLGLAVVAKPLIAVLLTEKWLPSLPYLRLLCVVGVLYPLHSINLNALKAQGRSDLFLRLEIIKKTITVIAIVITYRWGISAMICGGIVVSLLGYYLNTYYIGKLLDYSLVEQIRDLLPILILASVMGAGAYLLRFVGFENQLLLLCAQVAFGGALYVSLCRLFRLASFMELQELVQSRLRAVSRTD